MAKPAPPYYAVIFTSRLAEPAPGYEAMAEEMLRLVAKQPGYLGVETMRDAQGRGITVSYWRSLAAIADWRQVEEHREAQARGREQWYAWARIRVAKVEREYGFGEKS